MTKADGTIRPVKRPTISDVALACGLSKTTVSKVMNIPAAELDVPESTRQRVLEVAEQMGYRPSWRARAFASRRTHTIGLLHQLQSVPQFRGDLWYDIVFALSARFYDAGYDVQLVGLSPERERWRTMLLDQRLDGCVVFNEITTHVAEALQEAQLPAVLLNAAAAGRWTEVVPDDLGGSLELARYLVSLGHKRIAFLDDERPAYHFSFTQRLQGIKQALSEAGVTEPVMDLRTEPALALDRILATPAHERPTVLVAYHDLVALPFLHACWRKGLRVPQDLNVATFNDVEAVRHSIPPLTTVAVPANDMAARAVELLLEQIRDASESKSRPVQRVVVPSHLVIRESTARPGR